MNSDIIKQKYQKACAEAVKSASNYFEQASESRSLNDWNKRQLADAGRGSVYVYFDKQRKALYVGQTSRNIKTRARDPESDHRQKIWWKRWVYLRFVPCEDAVERCTLELLLILHYLPTGNSNPGPRRL